MQFNIYVNVLGKKRSVFEDHEITMPWVTGQYVAAEQLVEYVLTQKFNQCGGNKEHSTLCRYLTSNVIEKDMHRELHFENIDDNIWGDPKDIIAKVIDSFKNHMFYIFINKKKIYNLSEKVKITSDCELQFLRLPEIKE